MPATLHVKKGDTVLVLSGNDKGKQGLVKLAFPRDQRVIVEGVNLRWRHRKPSQQNPKGERVQEELSIHASNVRRVEAKPKREKKAKKAPAKKEAPAAAAEPALETPKKAKRSK
jgi:large subunit ribosomal protein L24